MVHSFFAAGWLQAGRGEKDGCRSSYSGGARPGRFRCVEQRDLGESVLLRSRRKCRGVWRFSPVATTTPLRCGGHQTLAPAAARVFVSFSLAFLSRYVCVWGGGGVPRVCRCCPLGGAVVFCCPVASPADAARARNSECPPLPGGAVGREAQTQGVQPSYSRARFSRRVASLIMYSTCSATLERLVLSGSRPSSFIFTLRHTPTA